MAYKFYNIVQNLTNSELIEILKNNNYHFEGILAEKQITGQDILELCEIDLTRWELTPSERRKLWTGISEIKLHSQKFFKNYTPAIQKSSDNAESPTPMPEKSENLVASKPKTGFYVPVPQKPEKFVASKPKTEFSSPTPQKPEILASKPNALRKGDFNEKLEQVIGKPKPGVSVAVARKPPKPLPEPEPEPEPLAEYLVMEKPKDSDSDPEEDGYLCPIDVPNDIEQNDYEPPPSLELVKNEMVRQPVLHRPPMVLPRDVPEPHVQKTTMQSTLSLPVHDFEDEDEDEESTYEPIGEEASPPNSKIWKLPGLFSIGKSTKKKEPNESKTHISTPTKSSAISVQNRKLPPLPPEEPDSPELIYHNEDVDPATEMARRSQYIPQFDFDNSIINILPPVPERSLNRPIGQNYEDFLPSPNMPRNLPEPPRNIPILEQQQQRNFTQNLNNERFYRNTDRKGARALLKGLPDGAFLFRPSSKFFLGLSLKYNDKISNLGIKITPENRLKLVGDEDEDSPTFASLANLVQYFTQHPVAFSDQGHVRETCLKQVLPDNRF